MDTLLHWPQKTRFQPNLNQIDNSFGVAAYDVTGLLLECIGGLLQLAVVHICASKSLPARMAVCLQDDKVARIPGPSSDFVLASLGGNT